MARPGLSLRRTLATAAENNESAAIAIMRAVEHIQGGDLLKQRLLKVVEQLHRDADDFRELRDEVLGKSPP